MCQPTSILDRAGTLLLAVTVAACQAGAGDRPAAERETALTHVGVIDPSTNRAATDMTVIVRGRLIREIGPASTITVPSGARVVDARGKYVIPGLWDMHVHTVLDGGASALAEYVKHGITTVRDMGGRFETVDSLRRAIAVGRIIGPRIFAVGPMIENKAALQGILAAATTEDSAIARGDRLVLSTPAEATRAVDSLVRLGVDMIKARDFADVPTYWAIANGARRAGRPFVGHPPPGVDPFALADSGQRSVEHWYYPNELTTLPRPEYDRLVAAYVRNGTAFVPTISAWHQHRLTVDTLEQMLNAIRTDPRTSPARAALLRVWKNDLDSRRIEIRGKPATKAQLAGWDKALDGLAREIGKLRGAGVTVLAGSDLSFATYPGDALHDELALLVRESGFTPAQALAAATVAPARFVGVQDSVGTIAVGKIADLVLLDANPLDDIDNVRRVAAVMRGGQWVWERGPVRSRETR